MLRHDLRLVLGTGTTSEFDGHRRRFLNGASREPRGPRFNETRHAAAADRSAPAPQFPPRERGERCLTRRVVLDDAGGGRVCHPRLQSNWPKTPWPKRTGVCYLTVGRGSGRRVTASQRRVPGRDQSATGAGGSMSSIDAAGARVTRCAAPSPPGSAPDAPPAPVPRGALCVWAGPSRWRWQ